MQALTRVVVIAEVLVSQGMMGWRLDAGSIQDARSWKMKKQPAVFREAVLSYRGRPMKSPHIVSSTVMAKIVRKLLPGGANAAREFFFVFALSNDAKIAAYLPFSGHFAGVEVTPPALLSFVLLQGSERFILAHNHPSGDPKPSDADLKMTARAIRAAEVLGLQMVDHVIVSKDSHFSFLDGDLLDEHKECER